MLIRTFLLGLCLSVVVPTAVANPCAATVYTYQPAPGQFVNLLPAYADGDTSDDMCRKVEAAWLQQTPVTLGAWGGYVVFGFDHMVANVPDEYDLCILGNASVAKQSADGRCSGAAEPGIVMVSYDANGNGLPDDEWYHLAGSEHGNTATVHDYVCTYHRPAAARQPVAGVSWKYLTDSLYICWTDNQGGAGYVSKNSFHKQDYWPLWMSEDELVFSGVRLPDNVEILGTAGTNNILWCYDYGYADVFANNDERNRMKIDWAVDAQGNSVFLPGIHFIKVYTAVNQYAGWTGEVSTEVAGALDLHAISTTACEHTASQPSVTLLSNPVRETMVITSSTTQHAAVYNLHGHLLFNINLSAGTNRISCSLSQGIYLLRYDGGALRFLKQ